VFPLGSPPAITISAQPLTDGTTTIPALITALTAIAVPATDTTTAPSLAVLGPPNPLDSPPSLTSAIPLDTPLTAPINANAVASPPRYWDDARVLAPNSLAPVVVEAAVVCLLKLCIRLLHKESPDPLNWYEFICLHLNNIKKRILASLI
jgi:hypothetical protein